MPQKMRARAAFRAPAVPLVTFDPYFSLWSAQDVLYADDTAHWTGARQPLCGLLRVDDVPFCFMGRSRLVNVIPQRDLRIDPLTTRYFFEGHGVALEATFTAPLLPDDLALLSRPVGFINVAVRSADGKPHTIEVELAASPLLCVNSPEQRVRWERLEIAVGREALRVGSTEQSVLGKEGDDLRIDWGYLYLACGEPRAKLFFAEDWQWRRGVRPAAAISAGEGDKPAAEAPLLCAAIDLGEIAPGAVANAMFALAYDDVASVEYFGKRLKAYWRRDGQTFDEMLSRAITDCPQTLARCQAFDDAMNHRAVQAGGDAYRDVCALAYRQVIAGHKLVARDDGAPLFFSKECFSNGCMGTVDVSYPSMPLFLLCNPGLIHALLRPVFEFADSGAWPFDFAPHDVGRYPRANGQVYGLDKQTGGFLLEKQMPVEESANMLIMTAAAARACGSAAFAQEHWATLSKWAEYLIAHGADPGEQLCTDDFSGRLAHNANLAVKACVGVGAFAMLCEMTGRGPEAARFLAAARQMSKAWLALADDGDHYRLAFHEPGSWSLKYNLIWDRLLALGLFPSEVYRKELAFYERQMLRYGVPLDNRAAFTKSDWFVWCAALHESDADFARWMERLWRSLHETVNRVPFTDWYYADTAVRVGFQARTVLGAIYIRLLLFDPGPKEPSKQENHP